MEPDDWTTDTRPWALAEGALTFAPPGDRTGLLAATPAGEYVSVELDNRARRRLEDVLTGRATPAAALASAADRPALAAVLDLLAAEGVITTAPARRAPAGPIVVLGANPVAAQVTELLMRHGCDVRAGDDADRPVAGAAAVVACADWLPDPAWRRLDETCRTAGVRWHRCWREGSSAWVGPLSVPGRSAGYADLRLRRLAASEWPAELAATWGHLAVTPPPPPTWDPATAALLAGTLTADVLAELGTAGGLPPSDPAYTWRGLDLATRGWHLHPVLALPLGVDVDGPPDGPRAVEAHTAPMPAAGGSTDPAGVAS